MLRIILILSILLLTGCYRPEPEGPAERIGKSIDGLAQGLNDMSNDPNYVGDSHTRDSYNTQGRSNENYRSNDYWAKSDEYWREHDPAKKFDRKSDLNRNSVDDEERRREQEYRY